MPSPTLSGRSLVAAVANDGSGTTAGVGEAAAKAAVAAINLSAARRDVPTEVRLCSARACCYMHFAAYYP